MPAILTLLTPKTVTDAALTSTTVPETDYGVYDPAHTYGLGDRCIKNHRIYESQIASNVGHDPTVLSNQFGTTVYWTDMDPTNRWALFDGEASTQTRATGSMTYVLHIGAFDTVYLGGMQASDVSITVKDAPGGTVVFTYAGSMEGSAPADYYEYFFAPFSYLKSRIITGIPPYADMELTITISNGTTGTVLCGILAVGILQKLGKTQQGATAKPKNFGYVDIDKYGKATIVPGKKATDLSASALIDSSEARIVQGYLEDAVQTAAMVSCSDSADYSGLNTFGIVSGQVVYKQSGSHEISIEVQGLI